MQNYKAHVEAQLDAQRHSAEQAARPQVTTAERARDLAKSMMAAIKDNNDAEARRLAIELKPLLGFLPE